MDLEKPIFKDVYNFLTKNINTNGTDEDWQQIMTEGREISNLHKCKLCDDMLLAVISHLELKIEKIGSDIN